MRYSDTGEDDVRRDLAGPAGHRVEVAQAELTSTMVFVMVDGAACTEIEVRLRYGVDDPYAVTATFAVGPGDAAVTWVLSRELLTDGLTTPAGDGDVRVRPAAGDADVLWVELAVDAMAAVFEVPRHGMAAFLADTCRLVPAGAEDRWLEIDNVIRRLLRTDGL